MITGCVTLVAKVGEEIAGFILASLLIPARDAYIHTVAVTKKFRHHGLASELVQRTVEEIKTKQPEINHIFADTQVGNEASLSLFKKAHFQTGDRFYYVDMLLEGH